MERFISNRRRGPTCESDRAGSCQWRKKMPALLRLDSTGDNGSTSPCQNSPKMTDSKQRKSYCSVKSFKNYFKFGNFMESAFGLGSMSTKRNLTPSEPISYEVIADHHSPDDHISHEIYKESKVCDSVKKGKQFTETTRLWQGIGFGCGQNVCSQLSNVSCCHNGNLLSDHKRDMNSFRQFHEKKLEHHSQGVNKIKQNSDMCQTYRQGRSDARNIKSYGHRWSSSRISQHSREYSPRNSRRHSSCIRSNDDKHSNEVMSSSCKNSSNDYSPITCSGKKLQNEITLNNTKPCDRVEFKNYSDEKTSTSPIVQLDWFTYGDTGYATVETNDSSDKTLDTHQELHRLGEENISCDIGHSVNVCMQLGGSKIAENAQQNEELKNFLSETSDNVVSNCSTYKIPNCDTSQSSSASKPFHCSNIVKSNGAKDYSYMLSLRSNKKHRPSAKKRRRRKAKEQYIQFCSIKADSNHELTSVQKSCSPPGALAFILGVDFCDRKCTGDQTRSFYVSFSDGDDTDFSEEEDGDVYDNDWNIYEENEDPLCLFNFNFRCPQDVQKSKPNDKIKKYNLIWEVGSSEDYTTPAKKVHFPEERHLVKVYPMIAWEYAYRSARKGPWEQFARDRERFSRRITEIKDVILPVLESTYRNWIFNQYRVS